MSKQAERSRSIRFPKTGPVEDILFSAISKQALDNAELLGERQELDWINASRKGDVASFNKLVLKWEKPIYNLCLRMLREPDEAAESAQEVFLSAFKNISRFRRDSQFSTWLYRIAVNHCISRLRKRPAGVSVSLDRSDEGVEVRRSLLSTRSQEDDFLREESDREIRLALELLTPEQKIIIELKFFHDQTFDQIASILEIPLSTIKSRMYQALDTLKLQLGREKRRAPGAAASRANS